jgi:hypothetical protein
LAIKCKETWHNKGTVRGRKKEKKEKLTGKKEGLPRRSIENGKWIGDYDESD